MSELIQVDVKDMAQYVTQMDGIFNDLYMAQEQINAAYNKVVREWCDKISMDTGDLLYNVSVELEELNGYFVEMLTKLAAGYAKMSEGYLEKSWDATVRTYELSCVPDVYDAVTTRISGTTVEAIRLFEKDLEEYIARVRHDVDRCNAALNEVGYWRDVFYTKTREKVDTFSVTVRKSMNTLEELNGWIVKRRRSFEEALDIITGGLQ